MGVIKENKGFAKQEDCTKCGGNGPHVAQNGNTIN